MTKLLLDRPVTTWVLFAALVVLGVYACPKLRVESMPEVELPSVTVSTNWTGASPTAVHRSITVPIEEAVRRVHGIEEVVARSYPGRSLIDVSFRRNVNVEYARLELAEQLGAVRHNLPATAQPPQIVGDVPDEFQTDEFFSVSLTSALDPNDLRAEAEKWIVPQVMGIDGVAHAEIRGGADRVLRVILDREKIELQNLSADAIFQSILSLDDVAAGGVVRQGALEILVSIRDDSTVSAFHKLVIARRGERLILLPEVAAIRWEHEDPVYLVRVDGKNLVRLHVEKRRGSNAVTVSRAVRAKLPEIEAGLPFPVEFEIDDDAGEELERKLIELIYRSLMILGILLVLLLISMRSLALAGTVIASILLAVVISLSLFYFVGISVNFITISGLTVCFGMILDNSILVLDSVHRRVGDAVGGFTAGWRGRLCARRALREITRGAHEVAFPILGTTLTTMVAFLSFVFLSGRLSLYYAPLAVAVATAMGASILVALGWMPVALRTVWLRTTGDAHGRDDDGTEAGAVGLHVEEPPGRFERLVGGTLKLWWLVSLIALGSLAAGYYIFENKVSKGGFFRMPEREELIVQLRLPEGTDILMTYETAKRFEHELLPVPEGARVTMTAYRNYGSLNIRFDKKLMKSATPLQYRYALIDLAEKMAGMGIYIAGFDEQAYVKGFFGGIRNNSTIRVTGYNSMHLERITDEIYEKIRRNRRVRHARVLNDMRYLYSPQEESVIHIDRGRIKDLDVSVAEVVGLLRRIIGVDYPTSMIIDGEAERMQMRYDDADQIEFGEIAGRIVQTQSGKRVRLGDILSMETIGLAGPIVREDQRYARYVSWEYIGTESMRSSFIRRTLEGLDLPYGYAAEEPEQSYLTQEEQEQLTLMLILAAAFIYMILAGLFESLTLPFLVLASVPMSLVGVFLIFWLTGTTFDSSAHIGLILLFGIVVNNAILLVARYRIEARERLRRWLPRGQGGRERQGGGDRQGGRERQGGGDRQGDGDRQGGGDRRDTGNGVDEDALPRGPFGLRVLPRGERVGALKSSICHGTRVRLRSILLTSGTTIVGLAPLLIRFEQLEGRDIWENLALSSIGGLTASVILILLSLPAAYYVAVRLAWFLYERVLRKGADT